MEKTLIEEMINHQKAWLESGLLFDKWIKNYLHKYLEMSKTSTCSFTTGYVNNCVEIDHNEIELTKEVEEYYDWLESTKCQCDEGFCETQNNCKGLYSKI